MVSGAVRLPQLHHNIPRVRSILPFVFFILLPVHLFYTMNHLNITNHQSVLSVSSLPFVFFSVDHFHTNVSNISQLTDKAQRFFLLFFSKNRDTLVTILQSCFFYQLQKKRKVNKWIKNKTFKRISIIKLIYSK